MAAPSNISGPINPMTVVAGGYNTVAASQSAQVLSAISGGTTGAKGDFISRLIVTVNTAATGTVSLIDGTGGSAVTMALFPATPGGGVGVYSVDLNMFSKIGAWQLTTGAGATAVATGLFS